MKKRGTHTIVFVWFDFLILFSSLKLKNFEWEWWKPKTPNWCFQFLRYITKWQDCKIFYLYGAHSFVLSCQLRPVWYYRCKFKGEDHFSFSVPSKYFSQNFPPFLTSLSHFITPSNRSTQWVWSHFSAPGSKLKWVWNHFSVRCKDHLNAILWSSPRCVYLYLPLHCQWLVWFGYCDIISVSFIFAHRYWWVCWSGFFSMNSSSIFLSFYNFCFTDLHLGLSFHYLCFIEVGLTFFLVVWNCM